MKYIKILISIIALAIIGCKKRPELPAPTPADFSITITSISPSKFPNDKNLVIVQNTTGFVSKWTFEGANKETSERNTDSIYFAKAGTYKIKLQSASKGGLTTTEKTVTIAEDSKIPADFEVTKLDDYHYKVKNTTVISESVLWYFPDGTSSTANEDTAYVAYAGDQAIKLKAELVKGVFVTVTKMITISVSDPSNPNVTDTVLAHLTGGPSNPNGKTWVVDKGSKKINVGSGSDMKSSYYNWPDGFNDAGFVNGMYANEFTFKYNQVYVPKNQLISCGGQFADAYFGIKTITDWAAADGVNGTYNTVKVEDPNHVESAFVFKTNDWDYIKDKTKSNTTGATIEFTTGSYIGWFANNHKFFIVSISATQMVLGHYYSDHAYDDSPANKKLSQTSSYSNFRTFTFNAK